MSFSTCDCIYNFCHENKIECTREIAEKFDKLSKMLVEFNSHTNVTALKTQEDIARFRELRAKLNQTKPF